MTTPIRVLAAVIRDGNRYLVAKRPAHKRHGGLWEFPGGKVLDGEGDLDAIRRELLEELALSVTGMGDILFEARDPGSPFQIIFRPVAVEGQPIAHEHEAVTVGTPTELATLPLAPTDRRFVEEILLGGAAAPEWE